MYSYGIKGDGLYIIGVAEKVLLISPLRHYRRWTLHSLGVAKIHSNQCGIFRHSVYTACQLYLLSIAGIV